MHTMASESYSTLSLRGVLSLGLVVLARAANLTTCRYVPGDAGYPSTTQWAQLNQTVNGRLIATVPLASRCHSYPFSDLDTAVCDTLKTTWDQAQTLYVSSILPMRS